MIARCLAYQELRQIIFAGMAYAISYRRDVVLLSQVENFLPWHAGLPDVEFNDSD